MSQRGFATRNGDTLSTPDTTGSNGLIPPRNSMVNESSSDLHTRIPTIHIGMPKTATKTLQWRLFSRHSEIFYLGRFDGPSFRKQYRELDACRTRQVQELMQDIAYTGFRSPDFDRCRNLVAEILEPASKQHLVPVWSWESYSTDIAANRRIRAKNLKQVFGDANIIITIRHPVDLLESAFLQQLKRDNVGPRANKRRGVFYCTIEQWLHREWKREVAQHLDYANTIRFYLQIFGRNRLHVLLFEDLRRDSDSFFARVCDIMGVSSEEGLRLAAGERDNSGWTQAQIDMLRKIHGSWIDATRFRFARREQRRLMLGLDRYGVPEARGPRAQLGTPETWRRRVLDQTREGNEWLSEVFDLPLEARGYL